MAVAVKNPETTSPGVLGRLPVGILLGVVYLLGSLAVLAKLLPWLWWEKLGFSPGMAGYALLYLAEAAAAVGLVYVATRLLGDHPPAGLKAGIALAFVTLLVVGLLTRWAGGYVENMVYESRSRTLSESAGIAITAAVGVVLLALAVRFLFLTPKAEGRLVAAEEQGWFATTSYKGNQGQRVRRGTTVAVLAIVAYGVWSLISGRSLETLGAKDWVLEVPFTGKMAVSSWGDLVRADPPLVPADAPAEMDRPRFRELTEELRRDYVQVAGRGTSRLEVGSVVSKESFEKVEKELKGVEGEEPPTAKPAELPRATVRHAGIPVLPDVRYTLPLVIAALGLWLAWRAVNMPAFADFLIATEAELNKVSWTTRKRLIQDTIVVLTTVVLFTLFLFAVDVLWGKVLSLRPVGVLKIPPASQEDANKQVPW